MGQRDRPLSLPIRRKLPFTPLSRREADYTRFDALWNFLKTKKPEFVINAAGYTGKPNVDACETARADTLAGNTLLPQTIAHACAAAGIPWGHVSSGCIFSGAKVALNGQTRAEKDMTRPELRALVEQSPQSIHGFTETDKPIFHFVIRRAVFTAAPRRWAKKPWPTPAKTSGGCGFRSMNMTARATISAKSSVTRRFMTT